MNKKREIGGKNEMVQFPKSRISNLLCIRVNELPEVITSKIMKEAFKWNDKREDTDTDCTQMENIQWKRLSFSHSTRHTSFRLDKKPIYEDHKPNSFESQCSIGEEKMFCVEKM